MVIPKVRDETSVNGREGSRQAVKSNEAAGARIKSALGDREVSWLSRETGYGDSTLRDALRRGPSRSDVALAIATALNVSVDWILTGKQHALPRSNVAVDAAAADWVEVPEYVLLEIDERGKLEPPIASIRMRRDWLYASLGEATDLWLTRLPAPYDALTIGTGAVLICKDHRAGERLFNGTHYLFWINGGVIMARFSLRDADGDELVVRPQDIGRDEDQYQAVARIVGQLARPI